MMKNVGDKGRGGEVGDEGLLISNYLFCIRAKKVNRIMREGNFGGLFKDGQSSRKLKEKSIEGI